eukprot:TRINITY_DN27003_c0_g1_i1.p1 TRINITY_DN27003_c0_g1~~TRINITY_DN27003_c0_g1_i1.p1  ORF type:complete len:424 (+),score=86.76 TRINITY_DN27003_c0_g1_i1:135-1406(+)
MQSNRGYYNKGVPIYGPRNAPAWGGGTKTLSNAGLQAMTPRHAAGTVGTVKPTILTDHTFDEVEKKFREWVSGSAKGKAEMWKAWSDLDYNSNRRVSLAEIDKWICERFLILNHKPALMRAYKASSKVYGDDFVHKSEFPILLRNVIWFNKLWRVFEDLDENLDRRLSFSEFRHGLSHLGMPEQTDAHTIFQQLDTNHGGVVLFDEFAKWVAATQCPVDASVYDASTLSPTASRTPAEFAHFVQPQKNANALSGSRKAVEAHLSALDEAEARINDMVKDKRKLQSFWRSLDYNANGVVSLAEIDRAIVEAFPALDNKPALMRAYMASSRRGDRGDGFVHKHDVCKLLRNVLYFNKCWATFETTDTDHDRRMTLQEFQGGAAKMGLNMSSSELHDEFNYMDENNGGKILFDEFCKWVGEKKMPL